MAPNIVLVVVDDLGYGDLNLYGGSLAPTPNIDDLAAHSTRLTSGYATSCLCAPSRAGLLSGKYPQRFGFEYNPGDNAHSNPNTGMPTDQVLVEDRLHARGYRTGLIGKWHLGNLPGKTPMDRGFDRFYGIYGGASDYLPGVGSINLWDNRQHAISLQYITDEYTDQAVNFINSPEKQPFFLYLSYSALHVPYQATPAYLNRVPWLTGDQQIYAAMLTAVDDGLGRVRQAISARHLNNRTLVVFMSDNGGAIKFGAASNGPLNGGKEDFFEGGVRIPMMYSWPGVIPQNAVYNQPASMLDFMPTVMSAAGAPVAPEVQTDGVDLIPYLKGENPESPHSVLYWRKGRLKAIRDGNMKWLNNIDDFGKVTFGLFDLSTDLGEQKNLRKKSPEVEAALKQKFDDWSSQMMDPLWVP